MNNFLVRLLELGQQNVYPGENSAVSAAGVNATVPIGHVGPYVESSEDFAAYAERVALYFMANNIKGDRKVPAFLTLIGSQTLVMPVTDKVTVMISCYHFHCNS